MKPSHLRLVCCLTLIVTLLRTTETFSQVESPGQERKVKPPPFTLFTPGSVVYPGDIISVTAARSFKVKRGLSPYQFFIGQTAIQPTFLGTTTARLEVPVTPSGTYNLQIRYQQSKRKPLQLVFAQDIVVVSEQIAFESNRDGNPEIYVVEAHGSNPIPKRLTNNASEDYNPVFSPDGRKIAFQRRYYFEPDADGIYPDPFNEIHIMNADGTNETRLTYTPVPNVDNRDPVFSLDGTQIAFTSNRINGSYEIYSMSVNGTNQVNLTRNPASDYNPVWSPDGRKIAFLSNRGGSVGIWIMNRDGTDATLLAGNTSSASRPVFSPDGSRVAFDSSANGLYDIYIVEVTTGNVTQLTDNTAADYTPIFSPDGSKLAFTSNRGGSPAIYSMNLNGSIPVGAETKLVDGQDAAFNEDGSKITFQSYINGNAEIYIVGVDGSNLSRLTNNPASDSNPVWGRLIPSPP